MPTGNPNLPRSIGLGVSGGIAAYKAIEVMRLLQKAGFNVRVAMTKHAAEFVAPLTFRALSGHYVLVDDYDPSNPDPIAHINFSQEIELLLIVPATANIIAKFANGVADDFLTSTYLASTAPVLIAPAMNTTMWDHPATQRNLEKLRSDGVHFVEPVAGELACRTVGTGKLEDVENIAAQALKILGAGASTDAEVPETIEQDLSEESFLITVGGTREAIDPVRFISNRSSGKMGFALAERALARGAEVTVVAGSVSVLPPEGVRLIEALSAEEMFQAVKREFTAASVFVGAAAVADFRPAKSEGNKIKKEGRENLTLELEKTKDILAFVSRNRNPGMIVAGFAAETENLHEFAKAKLEKKDLDLVVANDISAEGVGFDTDTNAATIFVRDRRKGFEVPLMSKQQVADRVLDEIAVLRQNAASAQI
ncbi:MAG: bifunctional phosphopantothenoylcysteine decarboxylase/phosphopantothenate--cysteine ligase CoaBC [Acidobacteria bacterium]|nr:MAG: bifunctional phosphopantothenoylcysteine decarboxylase/phosphopantothenate--cysteine ligase CoaBC [Acidobacteriota bacterium]REK01881.1 MAG: bifunctional phosphopantothenoylcysteine decarboxylase/phosphopantothenate--cysteine ligase CoaBC [Acidobacteriota bacterium]REK14837.1 MAG: bifunctional phosphopantothenoylcysteine decarboxylase/phosphopantothenate--cysteine ligase CoaBC [Acidobacteriota bacterium]REK45552.1 MAG: bifunctional phosphopantothenoylcysteine decarboxylase/phosphopantoth